ncbi:hypothetical protein EBS40_06490 [bacterium]|nr:hypothetical protein [bacterium]NBW78235.1 hypothetical protein [Betaproteobacteria bacterium]
METPAEPPKRTYDAYKRYYQRNRDTLLARMRERYDPEAKADYYKANAHHYREVMKECYKRNKEARNKKLIEGAIEAEGATPTKVAYLREVLDSNKWKDMGLRSIQSIITA